MKQPVRYAIIRYQPHVETEEFANVGVVLVAPQIGFLDFRIETRRIGRLIDFFAVPDARLLRNVLRKSRSELERIRDLAGYDPNGQTRFALRRQEAADHLFLTLTKDREGLIRYSDIRYALHEDPMEKLEELFSHYVGRNFIDTEYEERLLEKHVRAVLAGRRITSQFASRRYSDGLYSIRFPFVGIREGAEIGALKPLFLGQRDSTRMFDHANKWLFAVRRLRSLLPEKITFAVEGPGDEGKAMQAFEEVAATLKGSDINVVDARTAELDAAVALLH